MAFIFGQHPGVLHGHRRPHLTSIVEAHKKAGTKIQPKKTKIFQTETKYLGHKVSQGGVQKLDQYVKDIQSWPRHSWVSWEALFPGPQL